MKSRMRENLKSGSVRGVEICVYSTAKSDSLYILTKKGMEEEFIEMAPGVNLELNEQGDVIGTEILNASNILKGVTRSLYKQLQMHN